MKQVRNSTEEQTKKRQEKYGGERRAMYLNDFKNLGLLPTPTKRDYKNAGMTRDQLDEYVENGHQIDLAYAVKPKEDGRTYLSSKFVEQMMGYPEDYTSIEERTKDFKGFESFPNYNPTAKKKELDNNSKRLQCLGNSIVPQIAEEIFRSLNEVVNSQITK